MVIFENTKGLRSVADMDMSFITCVTSEGCPLFAGCRSRPLILTPSALNVKRLDAEKEESLKLTLKVFENEVSRVPLVC